MNSMKPDKVRRRESVRVRIVVLGRAAALVCGLLCSTSAQAQTAISGSDGSDGALNIPANSQTIVFDPTDVARWGRVLDSDGDGVYNFTTITIGAASTLRLRADRVSRPVFWLASGDVVVSGTIDVGGDGSVYTPDLSLRRQVAIPGPGGFAGGAGALVGATLAPTPGDGPGGGSGGFPCNGSQFCGNGGTFSGNRYLIPLIGGSGGAGARDSNYYIGGGAGSGGIVIASSTSISLTGTIRAAGGNAAGSFGYGGGGSGRAIRLVTPTIAGNGHLNVAGGTGAGGSGNGGPGVVRLEAFTVSSGLIFDAGGAFVTRGFPVDQSSLRPTSSVRVTAVAGVATLPNPSGSFVVPDVTISNGSAVPVEIEATGVPPGTVVTLQVYPQTPDDVTVVNLPPVQTTLAGTLQRSTATVSFTFPYGFSRGTLRATWTQ